MLFLYIVSLYIFTFVPGLNHVSNLIAGVFICIAGTEILLQRKKIIFINNNGFLFFYFLFIIICTISYFVAIDPLISVIALRTLILYFIFVTLLINYIDNYDKFKKLINYFIYSGVIAVIVILINSDIFSNQRIGVVLGNVNRIGIIIGLSTLFSVYFILFEKKYLYIIPAIITLSMILLTGSRTAFIFIFISILLLIYFKNKNSFKGKLKTIILFLLIVFLSYYLIFNIPLFYSTIGKRLENVLYFFENKSINESSIFFREYMIRFGFEMFKKRPIIGYGLGNFHILLGNTGHRSTYAHNDYIELLVGVGILGLITYLAMHISILLQLKTKLKNNENFKYLFISLITSELLINWASVNYYNKHFYIILAMGSVLIKLNNEK